MWKRSVGLSRYAVGGLWGVKSPALGGAGWKREIARSEGDERKWKAVSGHCEKDGGCRWVTQTQTGAGPRSGEAIRLSCGTTGLMMAGRWTSEHLDAPHGTASTVGTEAQALGQKLKEGLVVLASPGHLLDVRVLGLAESATAAHEKSCAAAVGEEAIVTDTDEALGEDVEQEAATELTEREREGPGPATAVVLVAEAHGVVIHVKQPMVRDRDAVGVAGEIFEHAFGTVERRLGVNHPFGAACVVEITAER